MTVLTEQITLRLSPEMLGDLRACAAKSERTVSQVIRFAIRVYLKAEELSEK